MKSIPEIVHVVLDLGGDRFEHEAVIRADYHFAVEWVQSENQCGQKLMNVSRMTCATFLVDMNSTAVYAAPKLSMHGSPMISPGIHSKHPHIWFKKQSEHR